MKIALLGASGRTGSQIVKELAARGYKIKILTRKDKNALIVPEDTEVIIGDATDYQAVETLTGGCYAVISALGQRKGDSPVFESAASNIISAMGKAGIKRYISVTGLTIDVKGDKKSFATKIKSALMKMMFGSVIKDKQKEFALYEASSLGFTVVRVPMIEVSDTINELVISLEDCKGNKITTAGLASFIVSQITDDTYLRKAPFVSDKL